LDFYASVAGPLEIDLLSGLASLVDKNLVRERFGADGLPRFLMLETIREFAVETRVQAGEWESGRTVIKKWALEFLASARGSDSAWFLGRGNLVRIGEEVDNVRLAFEVASDAQDATSASLIFNGTNGYFYLRGMFQEALAQAKRVMDLAETAPLSNALRARTLSNLAGFWNAVYDAVAAEELARRALALAEHESEDGIETLLAMIVLVMTLRDQGRYVEAMMYAEKADALASKPDATQYKPWTTFAIGKLSYLMDDRDRAADFLSESMRLSLTFGPNEFSIHCGNYLAAVHLRRGDLRAAASMLRTAVQLWREAGAIGGGGFLDEAAVLAAASGHPEIAATLFSANSEQNAQFGIREDDDRWTLEAYEAACYQLGNEAFDRAAAAGRMLDFERAVDLVVHLLDTIEAQESNRTGKPDRDDA
ncbi:MAG: tetratricopeptide repeat protein, partial [Thermomicrobiales bacterium]